MASTSRPLNLRARRVRGAALALAWAAAAACDLPRDPSGTLERVGGGAMRVGFVVDTPWVTDSSGEAGGVEGALVRELARDVGATVQWVPGTEAALLESLHARELDLVVGGLTADSPWSAKVATTKPYYTDTVLVAGAPGAAAPATLEDLQVAVHRGDPVAAAVREKGGTPVPVTDLAAARGAVAAPTWRLALLGRVGNPELELAQRKHILAAAPGENAWLVRIERVLRARRDRVPALLRSARP
jgi:polar amino acid transport system substrate-binding protein